MRWGIWALVVVCTIFGICGIAEARQRNLVISEEVISDGPQEVVLNAKEDHYLKTWVRVANLAEEVEDYELAIKYYNDIKDYFPETIEAANAIKRLENIVKKK